MCDCDWLIAWLTYIIIIIIVVYRSSVFHATLTMLRLTLISDKKAGLTNTIEIVPHGTNNYVNSTHVVRQPASMLDPFLPIKTRSCIQVLSRFNNFRL